MRRGAADSGVEAIRPFILLLGLSLLPLVNSSALKLPVLWIAGLVNSVLMFLEAEAAHLPLAQPDGRLP
jgi:hypothetical protein